MNSSTLTRELPRREYLFRAGDGIRGLALTWMLVRDGHLEADRRPPCAPKQPHLEPRAKAVISLFMSGGVSHIDTFDPKPALDRWHGQPLPVEGEIQVQQGYPGPIMRSPYRFR